MNSSERINRVHQPTLMSTIKDNALILEHS